jgi:hypothetical protein
MGRYDASYGQILVNQKNGTFTDQSSKYGFSVKGEIRDIHRMDSRLFVFRNNAPALVYKLKQHEK